MKQVAGASTSPSFPPLTPPAPGATGAHAASTAKTGVERIDLQPVHRFLAQHATDAVSDRPDTRMLHQISLSPVSLTQARSLSSAPETGEAGARARAARELMAQAQTSSLDVTSYKGVLDALGNLSTAVAASPVLSADADLADVLSSAMQVALFSPLTQAMTAGGSTRSAIDALAERCVELVGADSTTRMEQAKTDLTAALATHNPDVPTDTLRKVEAAMVRINAAMENKTTVLSKIENCADGVDKLEQTLNRLPELRILFTEEETSFTAPVEIQIPLSELYSELCALRETQAPFTEMFLRALRPETEGLLVRLDAVSSELCTALCAEASRLADTALEILPEDTELPSVLLGEQGTQRLTALLAQADNCLHPADAVLVGQALSATLRALEAGTLAAEGHALCNDAGITLRDRAELVGQYQERVDAFFAGTPSERAVSMLTRMMDALTQRLDDRKAQEQTSAVHSLETVRGLLSRCAIALSGRDTDVVPVEVGRTARQALSLIQDLKKRTASVTTPDHLSEQTAAELLSALTDAESRAQFFAVTASIAERASLRTGIGTIAALQEELVNNKVLSPEDRQTLQNRLRTTSASWRNRLEQQLNIVKKAGDVGIEVPGAPPRRLGDTPLAPEFRLRHFRDELQNLRAQANRTLLPEDAASLFAALDKAGAERADELVALVHNDPALPRLSAALPELTSGRTAVFRELCLKTWSDPVFMRRLDAELATGSASTAESSLDSLLDMLGEVWNGTPAPGIRAQAVQHLETLTLPAPELDALSLALQKSCLPPDEHAVLTQIHGSERGKRELGKIFAKERGTDAPLSNAFLQFAVQALQGGSNEEFDFQILRVAWHTHLADERIGDGGTPEQFAAFQQTLPSPYGDMDTTLLSALMHSGLPGSASAHAVAGVLSSGSKALGNSTRAADIFQRICAQADRYYAEKITTILVRNLLEAQSVTGIQGLEAGGALRAAVDRELRKDPSLKDRLIDKLRGTFQKGDKPLTGDFDDQMRQLIATIPELRATVTMLLEREAVLSAADEVLAGYIEDHARNLIGVTQKGALVPGETPGAPPSICPEKLHGEQFCVGLLALHDILTNSDGSYGTGWREQKAAVDQLDFQKLLRLDQMRGMNWGDGADNKGTHLKAAVDRLQQARTSTEFEYNKTELLGMFKEYNLLSKSEAILFFKTHDSSGGAGVLQRALTKKHHCEPGGTCAVRMQKKYATLRGSGARAAQANALSVAARASDRQRMGTLIDAPMNSLSTHVARVINTSVHLAVLETFSKTSSASFADFLDQVAPNAAARGNPDEVARSAHFMDCLNTLEHKLGIQAEFAEMGLLSFFRNAKGDFLQKLAADSSYDFALALRRFGTSLEVKDEIKSVMAEEQARTAATTLMNRLGANESIGLNLETGVAVSASVSTFGQLDFRATLAVAKENGLCAWRGADGKPHLTLYKGFSGQMGISVDGILGTIAAKAHTRVDRVNAGELSFASDAAFANFMGELFSGKAALETLRHCERMAYSSSVSATGEAILTTTDMSDFFGITAGVAEFHFEAKAGLTKTWKETRQGDRRTVSDSLLYNLGLTAQLGMLGKDYIQMVVDPAIDMVARQVNLSADRRENAHRMMGNTGIKANYAVAITKTSSKVYHADRLSGAETSRSSRLSGSSPHSEAEAILTTFGLDEALMDDVLRGVEELHADGAQCGLTATWTLTEAGLAAWRAAPGRGEQDRILASPDFYEITQVSVRGTWNAAENSTILNGLGQGFKRNANGTLSRELVYTPGVTAF